VGELVSDGGLLAEVMEAAVNVGVVVEVVLRDRVDDVLGLLRRGCVVEVDDSLAALDVFADGARRHVGADAPLQDGEVLPDRGDVEWLRFLRFHYRVGGTGVGTFCRSDPEIAGAFGRWDGVHPHEDGSLRRRSSRV
jgi:hypothetical protein